MDLIQLMSRTNSNSSAVFSSPTFRQFFPNVNKSIGHDFISALHKNVEQQKEEVSENDAEKYHKEVQLLISERYCLSALLYAVLGQLVIGLAVNCVILGSIVHSSIQISRNNHSSSIGSTANTSYSSSSTTSYSSDKQHRKTPVIDIIVALLSGTALFRLLTRSVLQLFCLYGACFAMSESLCYFHGFVNTFLHYIFLWTMALFVQDRYIAHYKEYDYICKCSHFVLYITLICAAFLTSLHICGPVYGFASYRFVIEELTCTVDWLSRFSCPYFIYSSILVSGPAYFPLLYWSVRISQKYFALSSFCNVFSGVKSNQSTRQRQSTTKPQSAIIINHDESTQQHQKSTKTPNQANSTLSTYYHRSSKSSLNLRPCCCSRMSTNQTSSTKCDIEMQSNTNLLPKQKSIRTNSLDKLKIPNTTTKTNSIKKGSIKSCRVSFQNCSSSASLMFGTGVERSKYNSYRSKSHLLTESNEIQSVILCCWLFLLSYTPKMLDNACMACFGPVRETQIMETPLLLLNKTQNQNQTMVPSVSPNRSSNYNYKYNFYLTFWDECVACVLIPLVLVLVHSKLRSIFAVLLRCLSRTSNRTQSSINL